MLSAAEEYEVISRDSSLSEEEKSSRAAALTVEGATFEELALTMTHVAAHADPSVSVQPLCDSGEHIEVTVAARVSLQRVPMRPVGNHRGKSFWNLFLVRVISLLSHGVCTDAYCYNV